uniref:Carotenoid 1,2-hydratase n=1 Tax=Eiseniibacteriota bacterium TaxID=2212470 RepID=A0A832I3P1_UNCEI
MLPSATRPPHGAARARAARFVAAALGVALAAAPAPAAAPPRNELGYRLAVPPWRFEFPRDHAAHPEFQTEWWYYTGHLRAGGRWFGFELTFFRVGLDPARRASRSAWAPHTLHFAHAALTDERGRRFRFDERAARPALGMAGADSARLRAWIGDWSAELLPDGRTHRLRAPARDFALALDLAPLKPPAAHGADGVSQKSAGEGRASHYYSLTRLAARGTVTVDGVEHAVEGTAWMDHEFGSSQLAPDLVGWDWFAVQLEDGRELMLYRLRREDGSDEPHSSGTLVARDGRATHLPREAFSIEATGAWTSPHSGATYPSGWRLRVPRAGLDLALEPTLADQELRTGGPAGVTYWEGAVRVTGAAAGAPARGRGYVELTGYAGRAPGF